MDYTFNMDKYEVKILYGELRNIERNYLIAAFSEGKDKEKILSSFNSFRAHKDTYLGEEGMEHAKEIIESMDEATIAMMREAIDSDMSLIRKKEEGYLNVALYFYSHGLEDKDLRLFLGDMMLNLFYVQERVSLDQQECLKQVSPDLADVLSSKDFEREFIEETVYEEEANKNFVSLVLKLYDFGDSFALIHAVKDYFNLLNSKAGPYLDMTASNKAILHFNEVMDTLNKKYISR